MCWRRCIPIALLLGGLDLRAEPLRSVSACDDSNEWPPYTYRIEAPAARGDDALDGFSIALLRRVAERAGWRLSIQLLPWKRCLEAVRSGEILLALNAIATPQRERDYGLSAVLYETRLMALWSRQRHPDGLGELNDQALARLRTGGVHGYSYSQLSPERAAALVRVPHYGSLLQMLHAGRVDVGLINEGVMQGLVQRGHAELSRTPTYGVVPLSDHQPSRFHLLFTRARPEGRELLQQFDAEWALMQKNGEAQRLRQRYLRLAP